MATRKKKNNIGAFGHPIYGKGFAKYGEMRPNGSSEIPKDLEEASSKFATHTAPNGVSVEFLEEKLSFQEGAKWQREQDRLEIANIKAKLWQDGFDDCWKQMMKEAVEGEVSQANDGWKSLKLPSTFFGELSRKYEVGDKVRIIIVKED